MIELTADDCLVVRRTPLWASHARAGAKFTPFAGWDMPVLYSGVIGEHQTVRSAVGLFDVSHMGEIFVTGKDAKSYLQYLTSNDINLLFPGKAQYGFLLNDRGGVVDDIITYCFSDHKYLVCVNASNVAKDFSWMLKSRVDGVEVEITDSSDDYAQLALQGPMAEQVLSSLQLHEVKLHENSSKVCRLELSEFPSFTFKELVWKVDGTGFPLIVARTGYTGEDGFEIFCEPKTAPLLWDSLLSKGSPFGIKPIGLGARDTLRLEACLPLYGHELNDDVPAIASGFGWAIKLNKGEFIGRGPLLYLKEHGHLARRGADKNFRSGEKLVGFQVLEKGIVRGEAKLFASKDSASKDASSLEANQEVGFVTSGTHSPTLAKAVGLAYVDLPYAKVGTRLMADVRGKLLEVEVCGTPFYKRKK